MTEAAPTKRLKYVGESIPELTGHWVDVPANIPLSQCTSWIELNHKAQAAEAEMEGDAADEADWGEPAATQDGTPNEVDLLRETVEELQQRLEQPDASRAADAIASTARAMQASWSISKDLQDLEKRARSSTSKNQHLADTAEVFLRETEQERKKITNLTKANQKIMNEAFTSYSKSLNDLRKQKTELEYELGEMKTELKNNRKDIAKLRKILADWEAKQ